MLDVPKPAGEQNTAYTPKGPPDPLVFEQFEGINTATTRAGVDDKEAAWLDGFMPLGPARNLRTIYGLGPALYTNIGAIAFFYTGNIGSTPYHIVFLNNGAIVAVATNTGVANQITGPGTIQSPSQTNVGMAQWGSLYLQIVAKQTNGYFIWDGTTFFSPGGAAPPALGGNMPTSIGGTAIENYAGRVWIANGATITFSAPGAPTNFSTGSGGGNFTSTDSFLRFQFTSLKQTNGFLYLIGDSSINYISGVQTSGSPPTTTFTNQNADPETGSVWPNTVDVFNRNILFGNAFGAHVSYGGAVTKISEKLDGVYNTVPNFGNFVPSAAKAIIFGKKVWILLLPIIDPVSGQQTNKLLFWNQKIWWAGSQDIPLNYIQFQEISSVLTAWGTEGSHVYPLFQQPSIGVTKVARSKLWDKPGGYQFSKNVSRFWAIVQYNSNLSPAVSLSIDNETGSVAATSALGLNTAVWVTTLGAVSTWTTLTSAISVWTVGGTFSVDLPQSVGLMGVLTGFTVTTNAADMSIVTMMIQDQIVGRRA